MKKPYNIVFYFSDQQRADTCGCYGQKLPITPRIDALAKEGVLFENAFTSQPVCGPCRAIFQTGQYATATNCFRNSKMLPLTVKTLANYMEGAGYKTGYVGKWHLASEGKLEEKPTIDFQTKPIPPMYRGGYTGFWRASDVLEFTSDGYGGYVFDENMQRHDFKGYRTDCITDFALEFLSQYDKSSQKPFFLTVSHIEPHHQNNAHHYQGPIGSKELFKDFDAPDDLKNFPEGDWKTEYPDYLGACRAIDRNLGRIIDCLKEKSLYDNTIIIFTSDHGSHFRTRNHDAHKNGYDDYKRSCHEGVIHVPLVIAGGPFERDGQKVTELVSTASIPKTIVTLAGIPVGDYMIGENLLDVVEKRYPKTRKNQVFVQISESRVGRCLRTADWKYSVVAPGINGGLKASNDFYIDDFLYDLKSDPCELKNLVADKAYEDVKLKMREKLLDAIQEAEHVCPEIRDS